MNIPTFIAIDLETTGLEFDKDEIIEVALMRFQDGSPAESLDYLVRPAYTRGYCYPIPDRDVPGISPQ